MLEIIQCDLYRFEEKKKFRNTENKVEKAKTENKKTRTEMFIFKLLFCKLFISVSFCIAEY